jgi:hypothetical protein
MHLAHGSSAEYAPFGAVEVSKNGGFVSAR